MESGGDRGSIAAAAVPLADLNGAADRVTLLPLRYRTDFRIFQLHFTCLISGSVVVLKDTRFLGAPRLTGLPRDPRILRSGLR
jgi:hypothetical protein